MEGEHNSSLFANDGSFLERFKQLQQQKEKTSLQGIPGGVSSDSADVPKMNMVIKKASSIKPMVLSKTAATPANGKLAFSLKQKSKLAAAPVKLGGDEEDEDYSEDGKGHPGRPTKKQKLELSDNSENSQDAPQHHALPTPPVDPEVKKVAEKLAYFVAKKGDNLKILLDKKILVTPLSGSCSMSTVATTGTMIIVLLKRREHLHHQGRPKVHIMLVQAMFHLDKFIICQMGLLNNGQDTKLQLLRYMMLVVKTRDGRIKQ
ncbi:hypothetical protein KI387_014597, partial [Taxus chinensis]